MLDQSTSVLVSEKSPVAQLFHGKLIHYTFSYYECFSPIDPCSDLSSPFVIRLFSITTNNLTGKDKNQTLFSNYNSNNCCHELSDYLALDKLFRFFVIYWV